jgi:hypothetical protein
MFVKIAARPADAVNMDNLDDQKQAALFLLAIGEQMAYRGYKIHRYMGYTSYYYYGILYASNGVHYGQLQLVRDPIKADYIRLMEFIDKLEDKRSHVKNNKRKETDTNIPN